MDLSDNNIGLEALENLCEGIKENQALVSINLSGNIFNAECATVIFDCLKDNITVQEINIANREKMHRNRIGPKGCIALKDMLKVNRILSMLNIAGNNITAEGLKYLIEGLTGNDVVLSLNLSDNNLPASCIYSLMPVLLQGGVKELILRQNELVDRVIYFTKK